MTSENIDVSMKKLAQGFRPVAGGRDWVSTINWKVEYLREWPDSRFGWHIRRCALMLIIIYIIIIIN